MYFLKKTFSRPPHIPKSIVEALVVGAKQGLKMVANLTTVLIVFLAVIDLADATLMWFGERIDVHGLTLKVHTLTNTFNLDFPLDDTEYADITGSHRIPRDNQRD